MNHMKLKQYFDEEVSKESWNHLSLWNRVESKLPQMKKQARIGVSLRVAAALACIAGLMVAFVAFTPPGQAFAQQVLRFFNRVELEQAADRIAPDELVNIDAQAPAVVVEVSEPQNNACEHVWCTVPLNLEEAQALAGYELTVLDPMPEGFVLAGAQNFNHTVYVYYSSEHGDLVLVQTPLELATSPLKNIGLHANVESLTVNGYPAEFVKGDWASVGDDFHAEWVTTSEVKSLRWQTESLSMELMAVPNKTIGRGFDITKEEMLSATANLSFAMAKDILPALNQESLENAELRAGYKAASPQFLPEGYAFKFANYDANSNSLCQYYAYGPKQYQSLYIAQSPTGWQKEQIISHTGEFMGKVYDRIVKEEDVQLGGEYVANYVSTGIRNNAVCSQGDYRPNTGIVFEANGMHYGIFSWGKIDEFSNVITTKAEMIKMAAGLLGLEQDETIVDTEKFKSHAAAEEYLGIVVPFPTKMVRDYFFTEIDVLNYEFDGQDDYITKVSTLFLGPDSGLPWMDYIRVGQEINFAFDLDTFRDIGSGDDKEVNVWGHDAIYGESVWQIPDSNGLEQCENWLYWMDGNTLYSIRSNGGQRISEEVILQIAESMRP